MIRPFWFKGVRKMHEYFHQYSASFLGLGFIFVIIWIQSVLAAVSKASQKGAIPGVDPFEKSQQSFVFRAHRTHLNSLENIVPMFGGAMLCIVASANIIWTAIFIWSYGVARFIHMILYYGIPTDKNPSPRSYFYLIGLLSSLCLIFMGSINLILK